MNWQLGGHSRVAEEETATLCRETEHFISERDVWSGEVRDGCARR